MQNSRRNIICQPHPSRIWGTFLLGLLNLSRTYPATRLDSACALANREGLNRLKQIKSILRSNRDQLELAGQQPLNLALPQQHEKIPGAHTFH